MPVQPNRGYRDRCASFLSCHRPCCGALRSLCSQPMESDFIGSAFACASWIRPHLIHLSVQCAKSVRAAVMRSTSVRDWHLGQRGRAAARGDRVCVCGSGNDASRGIRRKRRQTLSVADGRAVIAVCRLALRAMVNIAHLQRFDIAVNYRRRRNACACWTLAQLEVTDATLSLRYQRRSLVALDMRRCDLLGASSEGGSRRALGTCPSRFLHSRSILRR
jgi:hypothetical protein